MFDLDRFQEIWVTITRNKTRSFLTGFGVFWGIFMLMIMLGAGHALQYGMTKGIEGFATNSCFMGTSTTGLPYKGFQRGRMWNMHNRDLDILRQQVPEIDCISPVIGTSSSDKNVVYKDNVGTYSVRGLHPNYVRIERQRMLFGRFINELDILQNRKVCVIGTRIYKELFPTRGNPLGEFIRVNGIYYQVVGVSEGVSGISIGGSSDASVVVPFTTLQQVNNQGDVIHFLAATARPDKSVKLVEEKMKTILKKTNNVHPDDMQALWGFNLEEQFNMFKYTLIAIAILTWIVGSGTLIAGTIGVSNIMLVTVRERTKEIGIRRALGAKPRTILGQIMMESIVLTAIAGILGLCLGVLVLHLADVYWLQKAENMFLSNPVISFDMAIVSTIILLIFGLLAGLIPSRRALRIKAIDAIREE